METQSIKSAVRVLLAIGVAIVREVILVRNPKST